VDTPKALAQKCDIICSSLPGPKEIEEISIGKNGILEGARAGTIYIDLSPKSPMTAHKVYDAFKEKGCDVQDAPDVITAINQGLGKKDFTAALLVQEERAGGIEVRISRNKVG
jgi:3-hydroxyisobutyrate dehydrogenase-like beta-hydroxyacid dehydrogenase